MTEAEKTASDPANSNVSLGRVLLLSIVFGLAAGAATIPCGDIVRLPADLEAKLGNPNADIDEVELKTWNRRLLFGNLSIAAAISGLIAGVGFVILGRPSSKPVLGVAAGLLFGLCAGLLGALVWELAVSSGIQLSAPDDRTPQSVLANMVLWGVIGAACSIAYFGSFSKGIVEGIVGGVLGSLCFFAITMIAFSTVRTGLPLPERMAESPWYIARVLWAALPIAFIGGMLGRLPQEVSVATPEAESDWATPNEQGSTD